MSASSSDNGEETICYCGNAETPSGQWIQCSYPRHDTSQGDWEHRECAGLSDVEYENATSEDYEYHCRGCHAVLMDYYKKIGMPVYPDKRVFHTTNWRLEKDNAARRDSDNSRDAGLDDIDREWNFVFGPNTSDAAPRDFLHPATTLQALTAVSAPSPAPSSAASLAPLAPLAPPSPPTPPADATAPAAPATYDEMTQEHFDDFSTLGNANQELPGDLFSALPGPAAPSGLPTSLPPQEAGALPQLYDVGSSQLGVYPPPPAPMANGTPSLLQDQIAPPSLGPQRAPSPQELVQDTPLQQMAAQGPLAPPQKAAEGTPQATQGQIGGLPEPEEKEKKKKPQRAWDDIDTPVVKKFIAEEILNDNERSESGQKMEYKSEADVYRACVPHLKRLTQIDRNFGCIKNKWTRELRAKAEEEYGKSIDHRRAKKDETPRATKTSTRKPTEKRKRDDGEDDAEANGSIKKKGRRDGDGDSGGSAGAVATVS